MEIVTTIFSAIISIALLIGFFWGFYYLMYKVFGIRFTSKSNYRNAIISNAINHRENINELRDIDNDTIEAAKVNLNKKSFAHTSDNI